MIDPTKNPEAEILWLGTRWLLCRLVLCGGRCPGMPYQDDLMFTQVGELDYQTEMKLIVEEENARRRRSPAH